MNYPAFLKEVDELARLGSPDQLRLFLHEIARKVPENSRTPFLRTLRSFCRASLKADTSKEIKRVREGFSDEIDMIIETLVKLSEADRGLHCRLNEEWDDWNDSEEEEFLFEDPKGALGEIQLAFQALHDCLDQGAFKEGAALAKALPGLRVAVDGEYPGEQMDIQDLLLYNLLELDLKKVVLEALYLTYFGNEEGHQATEMVNLLGSFHFYSLTLEDILQTGPKEINLPRFLPAWIDALSKLPEERGDTLLIEAQAMMTDKDSILEMASRYAQSHPVLYQQLLTQNPFHASPQEKLQIGLRAMQEVPLWHPKRSEIALLTADQALALSDRQTAQSCCLEAFRTAPTAVNYLRLLLECPDRKEMRKAARSLYEGASFSSTQWTSKPLLLFFDQRFDQLLEEYLNPRNGIGWSSTFMKQGIALLLMLLSRSSSYGPGLQEMRTKAMYACSFNPKDYYQGTGRKSSLTKEDLFQECFDWWKEQVTLPDSLREKLPVLLDHWISLRVEAIMNANRRSYYGECAAFVAALGEVLESEGTPGAKEQLMQRFRSKYPRRTAFREELRSYGMKS